MEKADYMDLRDTWFKLLEAMELDDYTNVADIPDDVKWLCRWHNEVFKQVLKSSGWSLDEWNTRNYIKNG